VVVRRSGAQRDTLDGSVAGVGSESEIKTLIKKEAKAGGSGCTATDMF